MTRSQFSFRGLFALMALAGAVSLIVASHEALYMRADSVQLPDVVWIFILASAIIGVLAGRRIGTDWFGAALGFSFGATAAVLVALVAMPVIQ